MLYLFDCLKFFILNVPDNLLVFILSSSPSPSQASRFSSSHTSSFSVFFSQAHNGSDGDGDGDGSGNRRGTHFLEKKLFFSSRIEFFVCFFGSVLYYVDCVYDWIWNESKIWSVSGFSKMNGWKIGGLG